MMRAAASRIQRTTSATLSVVTFDPLFDFSCRESGASPDEHLEETQCESSEKCVFISYNSLNSLSCYNTLVLLKYTEL